MVGKLYAAYTTADIKNIVWGRTRAEEAVGGEPPPRNPASSPRGPPSRSGPWRLERTSFVSSRELMRSSSSRDFRCGSSISVLS